MPDSQNTPAQKRGFRSLLVILTFLAMGALLLAMPGAKPSDEPVGKVVGVHAGVDHGEYFTRIMLRLKQQPSKEARINTIAQEACEVTSKLQGRHHKDTNAIYLDPLYQDQYLTLFRLYSNESRHAHHKRPMWEIQRKYCPKNTI